MDFITISMDTATAYRDTACRLVLTTVSDNTIIDTKKWLIKPKDNEFDDFNSMLHGIRASDVANEPEFPEIWKEVHPLIEGKIIMAHYASFYLSVLRNTLNHYNIPFPNLTYGCTYIAAKKKYKGFPAYDLYTVNDEIGILNSTSQTEDMAELALHIFNEFKVKSPDDFLPNLEMYPGRIFADGYEGCRAKRIHFKANFKNIEGDPSKHKPNNIFYGASVCITGTLLSMTREKAFKKIANIGGIISPGVNKDIDFLIVGLQDYKYVGEEGMSTKQKKVLELIKKGHEIEIMSEKEFLKNL